MIIFRGIKSSYISQKFGESRACIRTDSNGIPYRPYQVIGKSANSTCPINSINFYTAIGMKNHNGVDRATYYNSPSYFAVIAETEWVVKNAMDFDGGIGMDIFSKSRIYIDKLPKETGRQARADWKKNNKNMYVKFRYWHANKNVIEDNKPVLVQDLIQLSGSTGASSGVHSHDGFKFCDGNRQTLDKDNGYYGAVDFSRWYNDTFILDLFEKQPKLTIEQTLYKLAWNIRNFDRKTAEIYKAVARLVVAFSSKVVGISLLVKKK